MATNIHTGEIEPLGISTVFPILNASREIRKP
jgi:hypothetical protein